jgi:RimJ/RimL family protein N-acetyltransferase
MHTTTLKNGLAVSIRPIRADDRDRLRRAFESLDRETVYTRFFRYATEMTGEQLRRATETDPKRHVALVVTIGEGDDEAIIGGGRYVMTSIPERVAEIAFTVEEDYQGLGIASLVLRKLIEIGRGFGLSRFEADVLGANAAMLRVFARSGLPMEQQREGGIIHVRLSLAEPRRAAEREV